VQAVAHFGQETTLFSFAAQIEQARPWSHHLPTAVADMRWWST
jgi:amidase